MRIVALDPGGTTGWASFDNVCGYDVFQLGPGEHHKALYNQLRTVEPDYVVSESFEYRNRARPGLELVSKEYIGVAKLYCKVYEVNYSEQTAAQGKGFVKDSNIKRLGLWSPRNKHAMDAMRHLLWFIINKTPTGLEAKKKDLLDVAWK